MLRSGEIWTDAMVALRNAEDSDATLERVELVGASRGLRLRAAYATRREGPSTLGDTRFPPPPIDRANVRPLEGTTVAPHRGEANQVDVQLLLRIQPPKALGRYTFDRIRLYYRAHGKSYVDTVEHARALCVAKAGNADCPVYEPRPPAEESGDSL